MMENVQRFHCYLANFPGVASKKCRLTLFFNVKGKLYVFLSNKFRSRIGGMPCLNLTLRVKEIDAKKQ